MSFPNTSKKDWQIREVLSPYSLKRPPKQIESSADRQPRRFSFTEFAVPVDLFILHILRPR
jgi:hypothetical protein